MNDSHSAPTLVRLLGAGMIVLVGLTWPLWTGTSPLPHIPWMSALRGVPLWSDWLLLAGVAALATASLFVPNAVLNHRWALVAGWAGWGMLLSLDQLRVQPWAWEFFLILLMLAVCRKEGVPAGWRWLVISIYFWSAISKFDRGFIDGHGQFLLGGLLKALGMSAEFWPAWQRQLGALAMPVGELSVAVLLAWRRTRVGGWLGSLVMHAALLLTVGPLGLGHEPGVLAWNVFFIVQNTVLFGPRRFGRSTLDSRNTTTELRRSPVTYAVVALVVAAPALELVGLYDHWPAWGVYCARPEQVRLAVAEHAVRRLPPSLQSHLLPARPFQELSPVNVDGWIFSSVHCPTYPQGRYRLALIAAVLESADVKDGEFRIEYASAPDRFTGGRDEMTIDSRARLRQFMGRYFVNTRRRLD